MRRLKVTMGSPRALSPSAHGGYPNTPRGGVRVEPESESSTPAAHCRHRNGTLAAGYGSRHATIRAATQKGRPGRLREARMEESGRARAHTSYDRHGSSSSCKDRQLRFATACARAHTHSPSRGRCTGVTSGYVHTSCHACFASFCAVCVNASPEKRTVWHLLFGTRRSHEHSTGIGGRHSQSVR